MTLLSDTPTTDRYVSLNGLLLHYRDLGDPAAEPVVFLHGLMGHAYEWDALFTELTVDHRIVALDQRGHGESEWADSYDPVHMAEDVVALIESIDVARPHLVGHSMGALIAMLVAADRPDLVDRVAFIDVGPDSLTTEWGRESLPAVLEMFAAASYGDAEEAVAEWMTDPFAREPLMRHYVEHVLTSRDDGRLGYRFDAANLGDFARRARSDRQWAALERIEAPALLIRGEHSELLTRSMADEMIRRMKDVHFVEIADGSHDLGVQQPEAIARAVRSFLEGSG